MNNELVVTNGTKKHKVFLQDGFYSFSTAASSLHRHSCAEMHVFVGGGATFNVENNLYQIKSGSMVIVPRGAFHCYYDADEGVKHTAFQIDIDVSSFSSIDLGEIMTERFLSEIVECQATQNYNKISAYISLFCSLFSSSEQISARAVTDYGFLIHEFFSLYYNNDVHLCDLASYLHLSERQSERAVIEYTRKTFREALVETRLNMAEYLRKTSDMSLAEISQYVGYKSYNGFWKAMKKYNLDM